MGYRVVGYRQAGYIDVLRYLAQWHIDRRHQSGVCFYVDRCPARGGYPVAEELTEVVHSSLTFEL